MKKFIFLLVIALIIPNYLLAIDGWEFLKSTGTFDTVKVFQSVNSFAEDEKNVYFGNYNVGGIDIYNKSKGSWSRFDKRTKKIPFEGIATIYNNFEITDLIVKNNIIYASTKQGFLVISPTDTVIYDKRNSVLPNSHIKCIALDSVGNVWMTNNSTKDLIKFDGKQTYKISPPINIPYIYGGKLICDKKGNIWYGGTYGIVKYDGTSFTVWDSTNSKIGTKEIIGPSYYDDTEDKLYFFINASSLGGENGIYKTRLISIKDNKIIEEDISGINIPWDSIQVSQVTIDRHKNLYMSHIVPKNVTHAYNFYIVTPDKKAKLIDIPFAELTNIPYIGRVYNGIYTDSKENVWIGTNVAGIFKANLNKIMGTTSVDEVNALPDLWIRTLIPNPIVNHSRLNFFCVPEYYSSLSAKIYNCLGAEIKDITKDIIYDVTTASGIVDFQLDNNIARGIYYLNLRISTDSRTIPMIVVK